MPNKWKFTSDTVFVWAFFLNDFLWLIFCFKPLKAAPNLFKNIFGVCSKFTFWCIIKIISSIPTKCFTIASRYFYPNLLALRTFFYQIQWISHVVRIVWKQFYWIISKFFLYLINIFLQSNIVCIILQINHLVPKFLFKLAYDLFKVSIALNYSPKNNIIFFCLALSLNWNRRIILYNFITFIFELIIYFFLLSCFWINFKTRKKILFWIL